MGIHVYQMHKGPYGRVLEWEYVIETGFDGEPISAVLYVEGVEVDGEVSRDEMMRVWADHLKRELEDQAEAMHESAY